MTVYDVMVPFVDNDDNNYHCDDEKDDDKDYDRKYDDNDDDNDV